MNKKLKTQGIDPNSQLGKNIREVYRVIENVERYTDQNFIKYNKKVIPKLNKIENKINEIKAEAPNYVDLPEIEQGYATLQEKQKTLMGLGDTPTESKNSTSSKTLKTSASDINVTYAKDSNIKAAYRLLEQIEGYDNDKLRSGSAARKLRNLENKIDKIKEVLPNYPQLEELEISYTNYKKKHYTLVENAEKANEIGRKLTNHYLLCLVGVEIPRSWAKKLSMTYEEFTIMKNEFISFGGSEADATIPKSEQFYTEKMTSIVLPAVEKEINDILADIGTGWQSNPQQAMSKIETLVRDVGFLKNHATASAANISTWEKLNNGCVTELARLKDYKDNGGLAQFEADRKEQTIDDRVLRPRKMETPSGFTEMITTAVRAAKPDAIINIIHVTMSTWSVSKNELTGIPLKKYIDFDAAVTDANGVCFRIPGTIYQIYEGGGNYGEKQINLMYLNAQMRCANIPK